MKCDVCGKETKVYVCASTADRQRRIFEGGKDMYKVEQLDITKKILHSLYTLKAEGKNPKYCIMNHQTLDIIKNCVTLTCPESLEAIKIYGLYIATCDALDFGDVEVR